jgi:hypothetical protein
MAGLVVASFVAAIGWAAFGLDFLAGFFEVDLVTTDFFVVTAIFGSPEFGFGCATRPEVHLVYQI